LIAKNDLYWVAGFLEGEGSFLVSKNAGMTIVSASQKQLQPLQRLVSLVGGKIYTKVGGRDINMWACRSSRGAGLMMTLYDLMSPRRKEQITNSLSKWRLRLQWKYRKKCKNGHPYVDGSYKRDSKNIAIFSFVLKSPE